MCVASLAISPPSLQSEVGEVKLFNFSIPTEAGQERGRKQKKKNEEKKHKHKKRKKQHTCGSFRGEVS